MNTSLGAKPDLSHGIRRSSAGFTLIEILAVIAILALLSGLAMTAVTAAQEKSRVQACKMNLKNIAQQLKLYVDHRKNGKWPKDSGPAFLLTLVKADEITGRSTKVFLCPGTQDDNMEGEAYADLDLDEIDPMTISYAGRDMSLPFDINRLEEMIIAADDNDGRGNHKHITNVVFADGSLHQFDISDWKDDLDGLGYIPVGPDSPIEELQQVLVE